MDVGEEFRTCMADAHPGASFVCAREATYLAELVCAFSHHRLVASCTEHKLIMEDLPLASIGYCELCEERRGLISPMSVLRIDPWSEDHPGFEQIAENRAGSDAR
jgi:hypothetical protein